MTQSNNGLAIAPPDPVRSPMIANVFHTARSLNTALAPIFPYVGDGCLVPGVSVFSGGEGRGIGHFHHMNSVDEVSICFASQGSRIRAGTVFSGAREHLVGSFFDKEEDAGNMMVIAVVQRQTEAGVAQHETLSFNCEQCQTVLLQHSFPAKADGGVDAGAPGYEPPLDTLVEGAKWALEFNASETKRKCPSCGRQNAKFPLHMWGWDSYWLNYRAAERGRQQLLARSAGEEG